MMRPRRLFLIVTLSVLLTLSGVGWYAVQCAGQMGWLPFSGPSPAHAEKQKYTCGMHPFIIQDEPGTCPICGMTLTPLKAGTGDAGPAEKPKGERKIKYWQAPMDPTYIRDEPGKSPMGMDLVPVYEDEAPAGAVISIDPVTSQNMGVRTALVERRTLHRTIRTVGLVGYDEPRVYSVNAKVEGWIERLHVDETGQVVKKGQPLLEIYSPKLVSAQEEYLLALRNRATLKESAFPQIAQGAERLLESSRKRLQYYDISDRQIAELEKTGNVRKTLTLYAPFKGIVTMKMAFEGQFIKAGLELFKIGDISNVWVYADIYEYELPWVKVGQEAEVRLPFAGGKTITAKIDYLYPYVEPKTRTVKARLKFANPDFELKPDMYVNVRIKGSEVRGVLSVPAEAVINSGEKRIAFVALGEGKFEPRKLKIGLQDEEGYLQIAQGLLEGERVVTSAQFMLDSESKLREVIQKMLEPKKEPSAEPAGEADLEELF
ncbi:RND family efflux transporter, MFP subunit [Desulfuromonas soudanensis]|uniref:RND family efflux transporter, MFP subunit n=1 Tax=Desulfuromonas soudanensis TaxID=1603606 RepID=A0A0M3QFT4_9BACT|nr:efflux RND transporter periplasmic adaptor subunit [Desulfuromonas soudanensis]ALC16623.1 RND family efflux transporter, MFP subunit [Desulfuromonas soudanensis]